MTAAPDLSGRRVLITGGLGFIGSNLAHRCAALGATVTIYDSLDPNCGGNLANVAEIANDVRIIRADIRDTAQVEPAIKASDVLFNCAAFTSHPRSMAEPLHAIDVNCGGVVTLLEAARRFNDQLRFVHVGTSTQIGRMLEQPITERHPEFPLDMYSASKSAAERVVLVYGEAHGLPVTVLRLANVYGPRAEIRSSESGFLNYFVGLALQGKDLTVYGRGDQLRNVTFVGDVVDALILASVSDGCLRQVLFAVSDTHRTVRELAEAIGREVGQVNVTSIPWPSERQAIEMGGQVISGERAALILGWRAATDLWDGLRATRDYFAPRLRDYLP